MGQIARTETAAWANGHMRRRGRVAAGPARVVAATQGLGKGKYYFPGPTPRTGCSQDHTEARLQGQGTGQLPGVGRLEG